jgi:O-antigen ligase
VSAVAISPQARAQLERPAAVLGLVCACSALGVAIALAPAPAALLSLIALALVLLLLLPLRTLPALAMAWVVLVPVNDLPLPAPARAASPALAIVVIWLVRRELGGSVRPRVPAAIRAICLAIAAWLLVTTLLTISLPRSVVWDLAFGCTVLIPVVAGLTRSEAGLVMDAFVGLGAFLALFAIAEYVLHANPLLGHLYERAPFPVLQHWSTYRVTTLLGHPLNNALFFAAASVAAFSIYVESRRPHHLFAFLLAFAAVFLTGSRGALYLTPVGITAVVAMQLKAGHLSVRRLGRLALLAAVGVSVAIGLYSQTVGLRSDSMEARASTQVRYRALGASVHAARDHGFLGSGPGTSNSAREESTQNPGDAGLVIENSYLQLLVSIGLPGLLSVAALFGALVWFGYRLDNVAAAGAFLMLGLVIGTYNFIEGVRPDLLLLGLLGACCLATSGEKEERDAPPL